MRDWLIPPPDGAGADSAPGPIWPPTPFEQVVRGVFETEFRALLAMADTLTGAEAELTAMVARGGLSALGLGVLPMASTRPVREQAELLRHALVCAGYCRSLSLRDTGRREGLGEAFAAVDAVASARASAKARRRRRCPPDEVVWGDYQAELAGRGGGSKAASAAQEALIKRYAREFGGKPLARKTLQNIISRCWASGNNCFPMPSNGK